MTKLNEPPYRVINANHWATIDTERDALVDEVERLRAENERLRAALIRMVDAVEKKGGPRQHAALTDAFVHALNVLDKKKGEM